ncbi:type II toxin-antitoxin system ParD family antitoxin [Aulosira sp. FACHB-615]|uniref:type II toxin-antitoxin system ParD family antitoxin n=1 Tax=Aulosira sp. FACHB-615 TaxID=2692777 RepID=UPI001681C8E7|nr:type II toxin-antitoxin system ParD family antitoxin [Aulosira sp. FACHB-615]MBD2487433.1 type II toxin-antitoxin system ParD family antitoxin [Aulosira sp. FACHB-615]
MNIQLKAEYEQFIQNRIATGRYENAEDVIIKALKLLEEWEKGYQKWEEETQQKLAAGLASIENGDILDSQVVMTRLEEKLRLKM